MSLSDTFAKENIYSFTVTVWPSLDPYVMNEEEDSDSISKSDASNTKEKKKVKVKGTIKLLKVNRNSRAELRIRPSS